MRTFNIKAFFRDTERVLSIHEESTAQTFVVRDDQKFLTRIYKETDGRWKTVEVSDLSPSDINTIGEEIDIYLDEQENQNE